MSETPQAFVPGLYGLIGGAVNVFVLDDGPGAVTVVDAGLPGMSRRIVKLVEAIGRSPQDVRNILVTHADIDHVGGLAGLVKRTGAAVYASAASEPYLRNRTNPPHVPFPMRVLSTVINSIFRGSVAIQQRVADGDVLDIAGGIRVIATPGHTADHVSYFWERERVLFTGDLFNNWNGLALTPPRITWDQDAARRSARRVLELNPVVMCLGHGPVWRVADSLEQLTVLRAGLGAD